MEKKLSPKKLGYKKIMCYLGFSNNFVLSWKDIQQGSFIRCA